MSPSHLRLAVDLAMLLDELEIDYAIGGSVASSLVGEPRSTVDVDIAVRLDQERLAALLDRVRDSYYVPEGDAVRAVRDRDAFNLIHHEHALKVDLFVLGAGMLDTNQIQRRISVDAPVDPPSPIWVTSIEDQTLRKLDWYRLGGQTSDRQWRDVVAILRINRERIDHEYLAAVAEQVGLMPLLEQAFADALGT